MPSNGAGLANGLTLPGHQSKRKDIPTSSSNPVYSRTQQTFSISPLLKILDNRPPTRGEYCELLNARVDYLIRQERATSQATGGLPSPPKPPRAIELSTPVDAGLNGFYQHFVQAFGTFGEWIEARQREDADNDEVGWEYRDQDWGFVPGFEDDEDEVDPFQRYLAEKRKDEKMKGMRERGMQVQVVEHLEEHLSQFRQGMLDELVARYQARGGDEKGAWRKYRGAHLTLQILVAIAKFVEEFERCAKGSAVRPFNAPQEIVKPLSPASTRSQGSLRSSFNGTPPLRFTDHEYLTIVVCSDIPQESWNDVPIQVLCSASWDDFRDVAEKHWPVVRHFVKKHQERFVGRLFVDDDLVYELNEIVTTTAGFVHAEDHADPSVEVEGSPEGFLKDAEKEPEKVEEPERHLKPMPKAQRVIAELMETSGTENKDQDQDGSGWSCCLIDSRSDTLAQSVGKCPSNLLTEYWLPIRSEEDWVSLKRTLMIPGAGCGRGAVRVFMRHNSSLIRMDNVERWRRYEEQGMDFGPVRRGIGEAGKGWKIWNFMLERHREQCWESVEECLREAFREQVDWDDSGDEDGGVYGSAGSEADGGFDSGAR